MSDNIKVELEATVFVLSGLLLTVAIGVSVGSVLLFVLFLLLVLLTFGMHRGARHRPRQTAQPN